MRLEGWEERLAALVESLGDEQYELGRHDCFWLACRVVRELTGVDRWPEFAGKYRTRRGALLAIAEHGRSFSSAGDWFFGAPSVPVTMARRGDVCAYRGEDDEMHLVVCMGAHSVGLAPVGVVWVRTLMCECCWRVG